MASFSWRYIDPDNDKEKKFIFQVSTNSNFTLGSIIVNRTSDNLYYDSGSENLQTVLVYQNPPLATDGSGFLNYNTPYYWRVMVYDVTGLDSGWVNGNGFTVDGHPAPYPEFVVRARSSDLNPGNFVYFGDRSICYDNSGPRSCVRNDSECYGGHCYTWQFGDGSNSNTLGYAVHTYRASNTTPGYWVSLNVCDEITCCSKGHLVPIGGNDLPNWKEVSPF